MGNVRDPDNPTIPVATYESWRAWLMTGARRTPVDPRRMQGAHKGLKKILVEGVTYSPESPYTWKDFSGAMVRHAVDDAMRALPPEDTKLVKLAYFGGYSNREIAREVGVTEWTVQRRISRALAAISDHIQRGRVMVRRAIYAVTFVLSGKWLHDSAPHPWQAAAVAGAAAVIVVSRTAAPIVTDGGPHSAVTRSTTATQTVVPPIPSPSVPAGVPVPNPGSLSVPVSVPAAPGVTLPEVQVPAVQLPVKVTVPPAPMKVSQPLP